MLGWGGGQSWRVERGLRRYVRGAAEVGEGVEGVGGVGGGGGEEEGGVSQE